jgi:hypothetical protein
MEIFMDNKEERDIKSGNKLTDEKKRKNMSSF